MADLDVFPLSKTEGATSEWHATALRFIYRAANMSVARLYDDLTQAGE